MIYVGIDDTDVSDSPGTNKLARALAAQFAARFCCRLILRHQLLYDPRVPYTSHNSSACLLLEPIGAFDADTFFTDLQSAIHNWCPHGSDPGLCLATEAPKAITDFGRRCQREVVRQAEARSLAADVAHECDLRLIGLGGTQDGVIGALAAVGLTASKNDGRVIQLGHWPDDLIGVQEIATIAARGVAVRRLDTGEQVRAGSVDLGKKLRPNYRQGEVVLFVAPGQSAEPWRAQRLP
jgi:hypothetical protein